jgi:hypothetical protein
MKTTSHLAAVKAVAIASCALGATSLSSFAGNGNGNSNNGGGNSQLMPSSPTGWLTAFPTVVQTGTKPTLTWSITYPSTVASYVTIDNTNTLIANEQLDIDIRVVGSGVTTGGSGGNNSNWVPAQALISKDGGTFLSIFFGTNPQVNPDELVWSQRVNKNTTLDFGGRYYSGDEWGPTYTSSATTGNVRIMKNGEIPPTAFDLQTSGTLKSFMAPYLDGGGRVKIGPLDLLVMMELTQDDANIGNPFYNLQDIVLLVTCKPKGNNGHGNNIDGVDSSNPGNGHGGPNGQVDPSGTVDDERK